MARYCIAFESMKRFIALKGNEGLAELVSPVSVSYSFLISPSAIADCMACHAPSSCWCSIQLHCHCCELCWGGRANAFYQLHRCSV